MDRNLLLTTTDVSWSLAFSLVACAVCGVNAICSIIIRLVLCTDFYPLCGPDLHHSTHYYSYLTTTATATTTTTTTTVTTTRSFSGPSVNLLWDSLHPHCTKHRPLDPFLECVAGNSFNKPCWICTVLHRLCGRFSQRYSQVGYASCTSLLSFGSLLKVLRDGRTLREESTDLRRKKRWIASGIDHSASALLISHSSLISATSAQQSRRTRLFSQSHIPGGRSANDDNQSEGYLRHYAIPLHAAEGKRLKRSRWIWERV